MKSEILYNPLENFVEQACINQVHGSKFFGNIKWFMKYVINCSCIWGLLQFWEYIKSMQGLNFKDFLEPGSKICKCYDWLGKNTRKY